LQACGERVRAIGISGSPKRFPASIPATEPQDLAEGVTQHYSDALDTLGAILDQVCRWMICEKRF
jgi:hypothetical protein